VFDHALGSSLQHAYADSSRPMISIEANVIMAGSQSHLKV
jgi:hypothetical protein